MPTPTFELSLLGRFELAGPNGPIDLTSKKLAALLAFLACSAPEPQSRDHLMALLWGSHFEAQARQNLRQALTRLRRVLGEDTLISTGETISLKPGAIGSDVARFETLLSDGSWDALKAAVGLYRGHLLADIAIVEEAWSEWLGVRRERLEGLALDAMIKLGDEELRLGNHEQALRVANRAIAINNFREDAHRLSIRTLAGNGRRADALKHYEYVVSLLKRELSVEPDAATVLLAEELRKPKAVRPTPEATSGVVSEPDLALHARGVAPPLPENDLPAGERKHVTALYANLKESLELVAEHDPEEAMRILEAVIQLMTQAVHRYEGTVTLVTGDGIMALFGVPLALEDHAIRACYAALQMQGAVSQYAQGLQRSPIAPIRVRVGLSSGEVVIRSIARGARPEYRAMGQTTHHAARLGQIAAPGTSLVSAETLRLAEGHVRVKMIEGDTVSPSSEPLYELVGLGPAKTRFLARASRGMTRFIGRHAELEQLRRAQQLAGGGHGQAVAVVGEAGVGKSRFVYEATHSRGLQSWLVLESASVSYGKATSYLPVIDLLRGYFKIQERDHPREIREKVMGKLLGLDEALKPTLPALLALLEVPMDDAVWTALDPAQRRQRTLDAVRRLLLREAREQPLLLIFEDLHWIDGETQALLDGLVDSLGSARLLLLVNYRPEYRHNWGSKTYYSQLRLDALPAERAGDLLDAILGDDIALAPLKQLLVKRGNPFFLEETVRTLVETKVLEGERGRYRLMQPVSAIQVPTTVQAVLAARIDRLPAEDKTLLQTASVVGKDLPFALLQAIAELPDEALRLRLDSLQAAEFLYEVRLFPDLEYSFKHALTHEVTYGGLLRERRRELHARIVDAIETNHGDRLSEHTERLAHHALRSEVWEKALPYLRQAGLKAAARSALADARVWFEQALNVLERLPASSANLELGFDIRLELRPVLSQLGEFPRVLERLHETETLAERLNDDRRRGQVHSFSTNCHSLIGELDEALVSGARALEVAARLDDLRLRILITTYLEQAHYFRGEYQRVIDLARDNLAILPADWTCEFFGNAGPASVFDRTWLVMSLAELGRFAEATDYDMEALRLAEPMHHAYTTALAYRSAAALSLRKGDWSKARAMLDQMMEAVRNGNVVLLRPEAVANTAWTLAQLGAASEALDWFREGKQLIEHQEARGLVGKSGWLNEPLARTCLLLDRLDEAQRLGHRALATSPRQPGFAAHALHLLGDVASHPDRFDAESGETHYRQALALAEPRGMRPLVAHCHLGLGKLYRRGGEHHESRKHLATAAAMYRDLGMRFWLEKAGAEIRSST